MYTLSVNESTLVLLLLLLRLAISVVPAVAMPPTGPLGVGPVQRGKYFRFHELKRHKYCDSNIGKIQRVYSIYPMTLSFEFDLDILPFDLHAEIKVRMSVSLASRVVTHGHTETRCQYRMLKRGVIK